MAPRGPWALTLRSLAKLSPEEREPQHCLIVAGNEILEKLAKRDTQDVFAEPVDTSVVTDYLTVVKKPMDLGTVREKLNRGQYTCVEALREDIDLIWDNCCLYNAPETEFYSLAVKLREVTVKLFQQLEVAFKEISLEPPRRKDIQKGAVEKLEPRNMKEDNSDGDDRYRSSEQRSQLEDTYKATNGGQQESVEQAKPLILRGPKRRRPVVQEEEMKESSLEKKPKSLHDFKLLKYTHFNHLLQSIFCDSRENSPLEESSKAIAGDVLEGLERFFQASAPTARMLLSRWLNSDQVEKAPVDSVEECMNNFERKKTLAKLLLQQAGFHSSELSYDIGQTTETEKRNISKLFWNVYRSNLLEQDNQRVSVVGGDDSYSNCMQKLESVLCDKILSHSPRSFILSPNNI